MVFFQSFFGIVLGLSIGMGYRKAVFYGILSGCIVLRIVDLFIYNSLDIWILGRIDGQTAAVQQVISLAFGISSLSIRAF